MPGTHGSMTKAGKVRSATPKVDKTGVNARPKRIPRIRFRKKYKARTLGNRFGGQPNSMNAQKHNRAQHP